MVNKGVDLLAAAWPLIHRERRAARGATRRGSSSSGSARSRRGCARSSSTGAGAISKRPARVAARGRGYEGGEDGPAADPLRLPRRPARRLRGGGPRGRRLDPDRRPARARRGRRRDARRGRLRDAEHLARGIRDGAGRVGGLRGAAGLGGPLGDARGRRCCSRTRSIPSWRPCSASRSARRRSPSWRIGSRAGWRSIPSAAARRAWPWPTGWTSSGAGRGWPGP